jgi:quinol-cytochrome oxidoreductase complex cytochrome b subunit
MQANQASFTEAALERSAIAGGYSAEEFAAARASAAGIAERAAAIKPIKVKARRAILAAYGIVWLLFAIPFLSRSASSGFALQGLLTVALGITVAISLLLVGAGGPDPSRPSRAIVILLVVPVILLLGVAGLCLPYVSNGRL